MATPSAILNALNELLAGCGVESQKMELFGILREIARDYASGDVTDNELEGYMRELAGSVVVLRQRAGLESDIGEITQKLLDAVKSDAAEFKIVVIKRKLHTRRGSRASRSEERGLL